MNKEVKTIVKKTAKIACVTCVAAGAVAIMTSSAALKAITEGGKYLAESIRKIVKETTDEEVVTAEAEEPVQEPPVAETEEMMQDEPQKVQAAEETV